MRRTIMKKSANVVLTVIASQIITCLFIYLFAPHLFAMAMPISTAAAIMTAITLMCFIVHQNENLSTVNTKLVRINRKLKDRTKRAKVEATLDPLTKLLNRNYFAKKTEERRKNSKKEGYFLMLDLDYFKKVNDDHGHSAGDNALMQVTTIMQDTLRENDVVGRLGGEEFGIYLRNVSHDQAYIIAERLRKKVEATPITINDKTDLHITVSIGGIFAQRSHNIDQIMNMADRNLYIAKQTGRNCTIFEDPNGSAAIH